MKTLLLDTVAWDLVLDASGNIALADEPYSLAQDVATKLRSFLGTVWYDSTLGLPYFQAILGKPLSVPAFQEYMVNATLATRPTTADRYVVRAQCVITNLDITTRALTGTVTFIDNVGQANSVQL